MSEVTVIRHHVAEPRILVLVSVFSFLLWLFSQNTLLFGLCFFYFSLIGFSHWYIRKARQVQWEVKQEGDKLFLEEKGACSLKFLNPTGVPIFRMTFSFRSEEGVQWEGSIQRSNHFYTALLSLRGREEQTLRIQGVAKRRGSYTWEQAEVAITDPFGLLTIRITKQHVGPTFRVYPRMMRTRIPDTKRWRYGYRAALASPLHDEMKIVGVKPYENEAFRSIHWGATAKTGMLSAKKLESVQADRYAVYLNLAGLTSFMLRPDAEQLIEMTAGVCKQLLEMDCSFELWVNTVQEQGVLHVSPGGYRKQLHKVLEILSTITERDTPLPSSLFYKTGFRRQQVDAVPLIIGYPPEQGRHWLQVVG